eukprot:5017939-Pyramimonas_sp.AAC.1
MWHLQGAAPLASSADRTHFVWERNHTFAMVCFEMLITIDPFKTRLCFWLCVVPCTRVLPRLGTHGEREEEDTQEDEKGCRGEGDG